MRRARGLSQRQLSESAGVPQAHISRIESGGVDLRLSSLLAIAHALNHDLAILPFQAVPPADDAPAARPGRGRGQPTGPLLPEELDYNG